MAIRILSSASALAIAMGAAGASVASAQQAPAPQNQTVPTTQPGRVAAPEPAQVDQTPAQQPAEEAEKVVITGSLIATTPEDAPKPVEVYTADDLKQQGSPTTTEFIRSLTLSYGDDLAFGQSSPDVPQGAGFGNANLRGLGSNGTLVLMNGKNLAPWNGAYGADVNSIPAEALEAVEVLKDGASATYGAGAVGGVINFRTRRDIDAPQITFEKNSYDGSDGAYKLDFLTGWVGDTSNLMISLSHFHEEPLLQSQRDFSNRPFNIDPAMWTITGSNPGQFQPSTSDFHANTGAILAAYPGIQDMRTAADCTALGGQIANVLQPGSSALTIGTFVVPNTSCAYPQAPFQSLVNEADQTRVYGEFNADVSDSMEVSVSLSYSDSKTIQQRTSSDPSSATAIDRSTDGARRGFTTNNCFACNYVVPVQVQNFSATGVGLGTYVRNPFIDDFMTRTGTTAATLPNLGALYMGAHWRPFAWGGNPLFGGRRQNRFERESFIVDVNVKGEFTDDNLLGKLLSGVHYEFGGQFNEYVYTAHEPDIFASRLQNALMGYGGAQCQAVDRVPTDYTSAASYNRTVGIQSNIAPGTNGCQWFNPFASSFATSIVNGAANPQFNAGAPVLAPGATPRPTGYANPVELVDWMTGNRMAEYENQAGMMNALFSGEIPDNLFQLPGGNISWALGSQWRVVEGEASTRDPIEAEEYMSTQPCVWPDRAVVNSPAQPAQEVGQPGCTTLTSAYHGGVRAIVAATIPPFYYDTQTFSNFIELQLPILDNFNVTYNFRHEEYNGGDLKGDIWSVAGKYDITDNLYVRASHGTNYRADAALELRPGQTFFGPTAPARFGPGFQTTAATIVSPGIGPENDKTTNIGIGWESDLFEGRIRASVDFFEVLIDGAVITTNRDTILTNVFGVNSAVVTTPGSQTNRGVTGIPNTGTTNSTNQFADCNASLISFVQFNSPCVQGVTTAQAIRQIDLYQLNGPGFITNGVDYSVDFAYPLLDGTLSAQVVATQNMVYKARGYDVNGILFDTGGKRLGRANYTSTGNESRRWRANGTVRWANEMHNVSLRANYQSGVHNEAFELGVIGPPIIVDNPATPANETVFSTYGYLPKSYLDFDFNYIFTAPFWEELELRLTVLNIFDKDPQPAQGRSGYYPATGNPRGRQIEVGFTKKF